MLKVYNIFGDSDQSEEIRLALGQLPQKPAAPIKIEEESTETKIMVTWAVVPDIDGIPITGYQLLIDDGQSGEFITAYDGSGQPQIRQMLLTGLITGLPYRIILIAQNINGNSANSDIVTMYSCLRPSFDQEPLRLESTQTTITILWEEPDHNGCPLIGFSILRNTGS